MTHDNFVTCNLTVSDCICILLNNHDESSLIIIHPLITNTLFINTVPTHRDLCDCCCRFHWITGKKKVCHWQILHWTRCQGDHRRVNKECTIRSIQAWFAQFLLIVTLLQVEDQTLQIVHHWYNTAGPLLACRAIRASQPHVGVIYDAYCDDMSNPWPTLWNKAKNCLDKWWEPAPKQSQTSKLKRLGMMTRFCEMGAKDHIIFVCFSRVFWSF